MIASTLEDQSNCTADARLGTPAMIFLAGFGDNASMFANLLDTPLATTHRVLPTDLPGFGAPVLGPDTTLDGLAAFVADRAKLSGAETVVAHSVASIIASLAAQKPGCPIRTILSLEGNLTAEDAYFSGTAADYDDHEAFRAAFLHRLGKMAKSTPILTRYREAVARADPRALWQLGREARQFSAECVPGEVLAASARVVYLYDPANCPQSTLDWLAANPMERIVLENVSHWPSVDRPEMLAEKIAEALA